MRWLIVAVLLAIAIPAQAQLVVQNHDLGLITRTDSIIPVGNGSRFIGESGATLRTSIGVGTGNDVQFASLGVGRAPLLGPSITTAGDIFVYADNERLALGASADSYLQWDGSELDLYTAGNARLTGAGFTKFIIDAGATASEFSLAEGGSERFRIGYDFSNGWLFIRDEQYSLNTLLIENNSAQKCLVIKADASVAIGDGYDSRKLTFGVSGAADSYLQFDGTYLDIYSATGIDIDSEAVALMQAGTYAWIDATTDLYFDCGSSFQWRDGDNGNSICMSLNSATAALNVGLNDTEGGTIQVLGHGTGSGEGGAVLFYNAADYDGTVDYYKLEAFNGHLYIGSTTNRQVALTTGGNFGVWNDTSKFFLGASGTSDSYLQFNGTSLEVVSSGAVVVGDNAPTYETVTAFCVDKDISSSGFTFAYTVEGTYTSSTNHAYGLWANPTLVPGDTKGGYLDSLACTIDTGAANTISVGVGQYVAALVETGTGTVTKAYGVWLKDQTIGDTTNYSLYSEGAIGVLRSTGGTELFVGTAGAYAANIQFSCNNAAYQWDIKANTDGTFEIYDTTNTRTVLDFQADGDVYLASDSQRLALGAAAEADSYFAYNGAGLLSFATFYNRHVATTDIFEDAGGFFQWRDYDASSAVRMQLHSTTGHLTVGTNATAAGNLHIDEDSASYCYAYFTNDDTGSSNTDGFTIGIDSNEAGRIRMRENEDIIFSTNEIERMRLENNGDLLLGTSTILFAGGGKCMMFGDNGGDPTPNTGSNQAGIYAKDVSGTTEMFAVDEAGNAPQLTSHDPETGEWYFYSRNVKTGRVLRVDMERMVRFLCEHHGEDWMTENMPLEPPQ
jgi:hypothetical protein